jgi:hypothetical protein
MAKKTRKVLKQESQQRAIQQAQANVNTVNNAPTAAEPKAVAAPQRAAKAEAITADQEFAFVKLDVRRSLTLAAVFTAVMIALSFVLR